MKIIIFFLLSLSVVAQEKMTFFANLKEIPDYYAQLSNENMLKTLTGEPWKLGTNSLFSTQSLNGLRGSTINITDLTNSINFRIYSLEPHVRSLNTELNYILRGREIPTLSDQKYDQKTKNIQGFDFTLYEGAVFQSLSGTKENKCILEYMPQAFISLRFEFDCKNYTETEKIINQFNLKRFIDKIITSP